MDEMSKPVKITLGGVDWYYQSFLREDGHVYRLYDANGEFVREFFEVDDMTAYIVCMAHDSQEKTRAKRQEDFMKKLEALKGDMSDSEFASRCKLKYESCYQYLTGRRFPTVDALVRIADACDVTVDWLVGREDKR